VEFQVEFRRDTSAALRAYGEALALRPDDGPTLANLASLHAEQLGRPGDAQQLFLASLRADPANVATLFNYAALLDRHAHDLRGAARMLRAARALAPDAAEVVEALAAVEARRAGGRAAGDRVLKAHLLARPADPAAMQAYARVLARRGLAAGGGADAAALLQRAAGLYKMALREEGQTAAAADALAGYARVLAAQGQRRKALLLARRAAELAPGDAGAGAALAGLLWEAGAEAEAAKVAQRHVAAEGAAEEARAEAQQVYARVLGLGRRGPEVHGDARGAWLLLERVLAADPAHAGARCGLARIAEAHACDAATWSRWWEAAPPGGAGRAGEAEAEADAEGELWPVAGEWEPQEGWSAGERWGPPAGGLWGGGVRGPEALYREALAAAAGVGGGEGREVAAGGLAALLLWGESGGARRQEGKQLLRELSAGSGAGHWRVAETLAGEEARGARWHSAAGLLAEALRGDPAAPRLALKLAAVRAASGDAAAAAAALEPALLAAPQHQGCLWAYGEALAAAGDRAGAVTMRHASCRGRAAPPARLQALAADDVNASALQTEGLLARACDETGWRDARSMLLLSRCVARCEVSPRPRLASALCTLALDVAKAARREAAAAAAQAAAGGGAAAAAAAQRARAGRAREAEVRARLGRAEISLELRSPGAARRDLEKAARAARGGPLEVSALLGLAQALEAELLLRHVPPLDARGHTNRSHPLAHRPCCPPPSLAAEAARLPRGAGVALSPRAEDGAEDGADGAAEALAALSLGAGRAMGAALAGAGAEDFRWVLLGQGLPGPAPFVRRSPPEESAGGAPALSPAWGARVVASAPERGGAGESGRGDGAGAEGEEAAAGAAAEEEDGGAEFAENSNGWRGAENGWRGAPEPPESLSSDDSDLVRPRPSPPALCPPLPPARTLARGAEWRASGLERGGGARGGVGGRRAGVAGLGGLRRTRCPGRRTKLCALYAVGHRGRGGTVGRGAGGAGGGAGVGGAVGGGGGGAV
jgi:tetratricopeptide (TPR) repeat protein